MWVSSAKRQLLGFQGPCIMQMYHNSTTPCRDTRFGSEAGLPVQSRVHPGGLPLMRPARCHFSGPFLLLKRPAEVVWRGFVRGRAR